MQTFMNYTPCLDVSAMKTSACRSRVKVRERVAQSAKSCPSPRALPSECSELVFDRPRFAERGTADPMQLL